MSESFPFHVSIIILNYRSSRLVRQCVRTILDEPNASTYEIIVVDNASHDGVGDMLRTEFPDIRFFANTENLGFAHGNNVGISHARGKYILIMNPDITIRPGSIDAMLQYMDQHSDIGALGPKLVHGDGSIDPSCYRFPEPLIPLYRRTPLRHTRKGQTAIARYLMEDYHPRTEPRDVDWLLGAVLLVRREAIARVGVLDERFFLYLEDTDWCKRMWNAGFRVTYYPLVEMVHYHERASAHGAWLLSPFRKATRVHIVSFIIYMRKWGAKASIR